MRAIVYLVTRVLQKRMIYCCLIRAIIAGLPHEDKNGICNTVDGKLNLLKIGERDAATFQFTCNPFFCFEIGRAFFAIPCMNKRETDVVFFAIPL